MQLVHQAVEVQLGLGFGILVGVIGDALSGAHALVHNAGLVLADLTGDFCSSHIDGGVHVLFAFFHTHNAAFDAHRHRADRRQGVGRVLLMHQDDFGANGIGVDGLQGIADFLLCVAVEGIGDGNLASRHGNAHSVHLFNRGE